MGSTARPAEHGIPLSFTLVQGWLTAYRMFGPYDESLSAAAPTLLLLHGLGAAGNAYEAVASRLAVDHRILIPDMLGSGRTAKPLIDYRPLELASHIDELLKTLGGTGFDGRLDAIVGHSQGAAVAVELCRLRSRDAGDGRVAGQAARFTRVEKLVLIDPPPPDGVRWLRSVTGLPLGARSAEIVSSLLPHRRLARLWLGFLYADRSRVTDEVLKGYTATSTGRGYAAATARALHSLAHLELKLEDAPPTALLWGAEDKVFPPAIAKDWQARLPRSSLTVLPATGHCPHEEQPEAVAFAIREFLALDAIKRSA